MSLNTLLLFIDRALLFSSFFETLHLFHVTVQKRPWIGILEVTGAACHLEEQQSDFLALVNVAAGHIARLPVGPGGDTRWPRFAELALNSTQKIL